MAESYSIYLDVPYAAVAATRQRGARFDNDQKLGDVTRPDHPAARHWAAGDPDARLPRCPCPSVRDYPSSQLGGPLGKEAQRWHATLCDPITPTVERGPEPKLREDLRVGHQQASDHLEQLHASGDGDVPIFPPSKPRLAIDPEVGVRPRLDLFSLSNRPTVRQMLNMSEQALAQ